MRHGYTKLQIYSCFVFEGRAFEFDIEIPNISLLLSPETCVSCGENGALGGPAFVYPVFNMDNIS